MQKPGPWEGPPASTCGGGRAWAPGAGIRVWPVKLAHLMPVPVAPGHRGGGAVNPGCPVSTGIRQWSPWPTALQGRVSLDTPSAALWVLSLLLEHWTSGDVMLDWGSTGVKGTVVLSSAAAPGFSNHVCIWHVWFSSKITIFLIYRSPLCVCITIFPFLWRSTDVWNIFSWKWATLVTCYFKPQGCGDWPSSLYPCFNHIDISALILLCLQHACLT